LLRFEFRVDPAETVRASRLLSRRGVVRGVLARTQWMVWPMLVLLAMLYRHNGVPWRDMWLLFATAAFLALLSFGAPILQRRQLARAYAASRILREPQVYEFTPERLNIQGGPAATTLAWNAIVEADETDEFFLLFFGKRSAYYLPKRVVPADQHPTLRQLLRDALGDRARRLAPN
jgi:hypothetical protein